MWWKKLPQRRLAPTGNFWNPEGAISARSANRLLDEVKILTISPPWMAGVLYFL